MQTPGMDVAGRVVAIGPDVDRFDVGDEVFGIARGAYAEFAVADADKLARKPASISFEQAAVASSSGITALQALTEVAKVESGQDVLVIGASGGVGSYTVQMAKALGACVTGAASGTKADLVRSLGADAVIDYRAGDYLDGSRQYDLIIDIGGRKRTASAANGPDPDGHPGHRRRRGRRPSDRRGLAPDDRAAHVAVRPSASDDLREH